MAYGKVIKGDLAAPEAAAEPRPAGRTPRGVLNADEFEALTKAQQIVQEAEKKANEIITFAEKKGEEIVQQAQAERQRVLTEAQELGRQDGLALASGELAKAKLQAGQIVAASEKELLALALKIADKIIGRDVDRDPAVLLDICANAIEAARNAKALVLRVNPRDGKMLRERLPNLLQLVGRSVDIAIKDDSDLEEKGCIIQTEFGTIDAQLKTQLEMLRNVLVPDDAKKEGPK